MRPKKEKLTVDQYLVPADSAIAEIKVRGSKFIASIAPAASKEAAEKIYDRLKKQYYDATHNCLAYRISADTFRYSDDGEPNGTAGPPILKAIDGHGLLEIICVVTRYFGGTKLGSGGLARAYSGAAEIAVSQLQLKIKTRVEMCKMNFNYELENMVRKLIHEFKGKLIDSGYGADVTFSVAIPKSKVDAFSEKAIEVSNANIKFIGS